MDVPNLPRHSLESESSLVPTFDVLEKDGENYKFPIDPCQYHLIPGPLFSRGRWSGPFFPPVQEELQS